MRRVLGPFLITSLALAGGLLAGTGVVRTAWAEGDHPYAGLDTLARAMTTIEANHVDQTGTAELSQAAIRGMSHSLDVHSVYLDPDEYRDLQERTEGRWTGIGIEMLSVPEGALIERVIPGGPAALAGVRDGDLLVAADGVELGGKSLSAVVAELEGPRGEPVRLGLLRDQERIEVAVVRDQVIAPTVWAEPFDERHAYVRVDHFRERTSTELGRALSDLEAATGAPLTGIVLDLRDNPGGLLDQAADVVDLFVGDTPIVETRGRRAEQRDRLRGEASDDDRDTALVILVNGSSASASEIVAGALQDLGRATVVGTATFGKGSVQQIYEFEDGSALKLTVARYYLPSGRTFDAGEGVEPDVEVALPGESAEARARLETLIESLPGDEATHQALLDDLDTVARRRGRSGVVPHTGTLTERLAVDPQLAAAWDLLRTGG